MYQPSKNKIPICKSFAIHYNNNHKNVTQKVYPPKRSPQEPQIASKNQNIENNRRRQNPSSHRLHFSHKNQLKIKKTLQICPKLYKPKKV